MKSKAFIYYTHYLSDILRREIARLSAELPEDYDLWVVGCAETPDVFKSLSMTRVKTCAYSRHDLLTLPYPGKLAVLKPDRTTGSNDLALMLFFRDHSDYGHYWICEYDVRYTGSWAALLFELDAADADLMCMHLTRYKHGAGWTHWATLKPPDGVLPDDSKLRGFMPFCRLSQRLFGKIDEYCGAQWQGHYEALWPTIASLEGFVVQEIGGDSSFTPPDRSKKFYHSSCVSKDLFLSTFGAWPVYNESSGFERHVKDTLWHPVKETAAVEPEQEPGRPPLDARQEGGVAAVTMVYNEPDFLPLWLDYYERQVGAEHCYVIDHGSDDGSVQESRARNRIYLPRRSNFETDRSNFVKSFCDGLLSCYDAVIFADADEFLMADPAKFATLAGYCAATSEPVVTALGLNLVHRLPQEQPIIKGQSVLQQRRWAFGAASMSKPMLIRRKVNWSKGTHSYDGPMVFDGLINLHLALYDHGIALRRQARRRQAAAQMPDIPDHHRIEDAELTKMFEAYSAMDVEDVTLDSNCTVSKIFIDRILQSHKERVNDYYKVDLGLKRFRLWELPLRYRQSL